MMGATTEQVVVGLPKILEFPDFSIDRNNRMALESGVLKMIRKVRPDWPKADIILVSLSGSEKIRAYDNVLLGGYTEDKNQMVLIKVFGDAFDVASKNDELSLMRLFAHNHLGPRVYASFQNGLAYEYVAGKSLDYAVAVDKNVYPLVADKVGKLHRRMIHYVGQMRPSHTSHHVFHTLRNWLMLVPMRLADPVNHQRMIQEMPGKATLVNELDELELRILHFPPSPTGPHEHPYVEPRLVFCHNDLSPQNIIYDSITRNVALLHLEYADINFQALEIARHFFTLSSSNDLAKVGCAEYVPAKEFQVRWCQHYLAAFYDLPTRQIDPAEIESLYQMIQKFALVFMLQEIIWSLIKVEDPSSRTSVDFDILGYGIKRYQQYKKAKYNILSLKI